MGGLASLSAISSNSIAEDSQLPSQLFRRTPPPVTSADQVLNVMEFEPLARDALPPAHFGYIATGADDDLTVARNHDAYSHYEIRAHRFSDLTRFDMTRSVFGARWPSPIYLSAVSAMRAFHAEGEIAVARAARTRAMQMMLSTGSSTAPESVAEARGAPLWQQLYPTDDWAVTTAVGIGRPQVWGLAAFGQPGVEAVIDIYGRELAAIMRQAGTPTIGDINGGALVRSRET
jgi:4-hydroxymandelate oxidase